MNERLTVLNLESKTEKIRVVTADGKYRLEGNLRSNSQTVIAFDGGNITREDGVDVAYVQSWSYDGDMTVQYRAKQDVEEISAVAKELIDVIKNRVVSATEEGGAA